MSELARIRDTPSLLRNGNFTAGLSGWEGIAIHQVVSPTKVTGSLVHAPHYAAAISPGGSIAQRITRSDVYRFPSRRYVSSVDLIPSGLQTYNMRVAPNTKVGGTPTFGQTFLFSDEDGVVGLIPGSQINIEDRYRPEYSGPYRVGSLFEDGSFSVSPISGGIPKLLESSDTVTAVYRSLQVTDDPATWTTTIDVTTLNRFDRLSSSNVAKGFQPGDVLIISEPAFAVAKVVSVSDLGSGVIRLGVAAVPNAVFLEATNVDDPGTAVDVAIGDWFVSSWTQGSFNRDLPVFQYSFTLAYSVTPRVYGARPTLQVVDRDGTVVTTITPQLLENGEFTEPLSLSATGDTAFQRRLFWFMSEFREPHNYDLLLTIPGGPDGAVIGDVVLYRGNLTRRHDFNDQDDPFSDPAADSRSALDRLIHGTDEADVAIPRGTVLLYVGGPTCPPGFKRLESLANSVSAGLERLPVPDAVDYDPARDRTILTWNNATFDALDAQGHPIPVASDSIPTQVSLPQAAPFHGALETTIVGPTQSRIQPGMALRIRSSALDDEIRYDFSVPVRQTVANRTEVQGPAPVAPDSIHDITYPLFMSADQFDVGEYAYDPLGPPESLQPTSYASTGAGSGGLVSNPATFSGLSNGAQTLTLVGVTMGPLLIGEIVYVRWYTTTPGKPGKTPPPVISGAFLGRVTANSGRSSVTVERLDGHAMVVDGTTASLSGAASISSPRVFGPDVTVTRTLIANLPVWSARRYDVRTQVAVFGDVRVEVLNNHRSGIVLEPAGFVRYGDQDFDLGDMGHSHEIKQGDAIYDANLAPRVSSSYESLPTTRVARKHGHGFMARHHHVIPPFFAALLCQKL